MARWPRVALAYAAAASALLCAAAVQGAPPAYRFHKIEVVLNGSTCDPVPDRIYIVINSGDDGKEFTLKRVGDVWAVDAKIWLPRTPGSVRWNGKHTGCLPPVDALERTNLLRFSFSHCDRTRDIEFKTDPGDVESKYVRKQESCIEAVTFTDSETAPFVGLKEQLRLQLVPQPKDKAGGLWVNKLLDLEEANASLEFRLTLDKVRHQLAVQRLHGDGAPPSLSSNAGALDVKKLEAANFKSVTIKVH